MLTHKKCPFPLEQTADAAKLLSPQQSNRVLNKNRQINGDTTGVAGRYLIENPKYRC